MENIIGLNKFGKILNSRSLADEIFKNTDEKISVTVNFDGVEEATPSFCHEMFTILLKNKGVKVNVINANDFIKTQLNKALMSVQPDKNI